MTLLPSDTLLPPNASRMERAIELASTPALPVTPIIDLWHPDACPLPALPWLAWTLHVDYWELAETAAQQREAVRVSVATHRYKGTPWSLREIIRKLGFGDIDIIEGIGDLTYDGTYTYNGHMVHGDENAWAVYRVILLDRAVTNDQAAALRAALQSFAPARCHLAALDYQSVPIRYNALAAFDGQYNHGSA